MSLDTVLGAFSDATASGTGWMVRCPAHEDETASLSIRSGDDGRALLYCHAGCETKDVVAAVGLTMADLAPDRSAGSPAMPEAVYPYHDEAGVLLFEVVRLAVKKFRQRRPSSAGGWIWNLAGARRVLFGLPELKDRDNVFVVEGEKDAVRLRSIGLTATTNSGGAGKWSDDHTKQLVASGVKRVVILPDNDKAGRDHADAVARSCASADLVATVVSLPSLPPKGDVSDWLDAGHTHDELNALVRAAQERPQHAATPNALMLTRASDIKIRPVRWLWTDRLALGTLALLGGREGVGKSVLGYTLAADVTCGRLPGAHLGTPHSAIVAATEDSWEHTIVPRLIAAGADLRRIFRVDAAGRAGAGAISLPRDLPDLERLVHDTNTALILLDPLLSRLDARLDTHKDSEVRQAMEPLVKLADTTDICVLGLIHVNKGGSKDALTMLMGSRAFTAVARSVLLVMIDPEDEGRRLLGTSKNNLGRTDLATQVFRVIEAEVSGPGEEPVRTGKLDWLGETDRSLRDAIEASTDAVDDRTATGEAMDWLADFLAGQADGWCESAALKRAGREAGHTADALKRARRKLRIVCQSFGFPRKTSWMLPASSVEDAGRVSPTAPTAPTAPNEQGRHGQLVQSAQSEQSDDSPQAETCANRDCGEVACSRCDGPDRDEGGAP